VYELTEWGSELEPVVLGLGRWGSQAPFPPGEDVLGPDALVVAMKTLFDPDRVDGLAGRTIELRLGEAVFAIQLSEGQMNVSRGAADAPVARIASDPGTLQQVLWHGHPRRAGEVEIDGDERAAERFLALFPLPA
jgi:hypothetical protein